MKKKRIAYFKRYYGINVEYYRIDGRCKYGIYEYEWYDKSKKIWRQGIGRLFSDLNYIEVSESELVLELL